MQTKSTAKILFFVVNFFIASLQAQPFFGQTLQINTHFLEVYGKPEWLLVVREMESGRVLPYLYEVKDNDNFWIAFTSGRSYRVTASTLKFGPFAKIANFCKLENGIIKDKSISIILTGVLSPDTHSYKCKVSMFKDLSSNYTDSFY